MHSDELGSPQSACAGFNELLQEIVSCVGVTQDDQSSGHVAFVSNKIMLKSSCCKHKTCMKLMSHFGKM